MRLTLRTLLAYLDDLLGPEETREIGTKVAESPVAAELIGRIRKVVRQRRLTVPGDSDGGFGGRYIDPNLVAEYLDNVLPLDQVEKTERRLMDDDVRLAEVAASHQVLSLVLGEPVEIPAGVRARARAAVALPDRQASSGHAVAAPPPATKQSGGAVQPPADQPAAAPGETFADPVPGPQADLRKFLPYALLGGVAAAWFALIWFDPGVGGWLAPPDDLAPPADATKEIVAAAPEVDGDTADGKPEATDGDETADVPRPEPTALPDPPAADVPDLPVPEGEVVASTTTVTDAAAGVPAADADPSAAPAAGVSTVPDQPETPAAEKTPEPLPPASQAVATADPQKGLLLRRAPDEAGWVRVTGFGPIGPGTELAVPEPFAAELIAADPVRPLRIIMDGGSRMTWEAAVVPTVRPVRGRVTLVGSVAPETLAVFTDQPLAPELPVVPGEGPAAFRIAGSDGAAELVLDDASACVAVERIRPASVVRDDRLMPVTLVSVVTGGVEITDASGAVRTLPEGQTAVLDDGSLFTTVGSGGPLAEAAYTQAAASEGDVPTPLSVSAPAEGDEIADVLTAGVDAGIVLPPLLADRRETVAVRAVRGLGLIGAVDPLVRAMCTPTHEATVPEAVAELRIAVATFPDADAQLKDALAAALPQTEAETVYSLLVTLTVAELEPAAVGAVLDAMLADSELIRVLAFEQFVTRTGRRFGYRPDLNTTRRLSSTRRMRDYVERVGGLVAEPEEPADPPDATP